MSPVKTTDLAFLLDENLGMVQLVAGNTRLGVHRGVLAASSPVLGAMLQDLPADNTAQLTVPDVEGPVLTKLVTFMYATHLSQLDGMGPQLLAAADRYAVDGLRTECERLMAIENAAQ